MNKFSSFSIRTKVLGIVLSVIMLLGVGAYVNMRNFSLDFQHNIEKSITTAAVDLGERIGAQFFERYGDVQAFAMNDTIETLDGAKMQETLDQYVALYGLYDLIIVVDKRGYLVGVNSKDVAGKSVDLKALQEFNFKDSTWFKAAMKGEFTESKENAFSGTYFEDFMLDPVIKAAFKEDRYGSSFTAPIKDSKGNVIGLVSNRAGKRWVENELFSVQAQQRSAGYQKPEVTITNKDGIILSFVGTNEATGKPEIVESADRILSENFIKKHASAGPAALQQKTGYAESIYDGETATDIVGFHLIENKKWVPAIGWYAFVHDGKEDALRAVNSATNNFYLIFSMIAFISVALGVWFSLVISKSLASVTETLATNSSEVTDASNKIASSATELSEAATEQAASLQETMAAVDEISAMVEKNAEAAGRSKDVSAQSREAAEKGRRIVENMLAAIDDIDHSNDEVSGQMDSSNQELSEITKLINDIGSKTKVINEIVFQTKLLSFNASVEAARAGEYGKGFAVVAEEVGNLAQMSGNAAKEISTLLEESVRKVEAIVSNTKVKVERLMASSKDKVKTGAQTARDCNEALEQILTNVQAVDSLVSEIAVASNEQSAGIREISKAVGQMEQVTQQNSTVAQSSSVSAEQLRTQSSVLNTIVQDLVVIVQGHVDEDKMQERMQRKSAKPSSSRANVVPMKKRPSASFASNAHKPEVPVKKVSGDDFTPSSDDPGFSEN